MARKLSTRKKSTLKKSVKKSKGEKRKSVKKSVKKSKSRKRKSTLKKSVKKSKSRKRKSVKKSVKKSKGRKRKSVKKSVKKSKGRKRKSVKKSKGGVGEGVGEGEGESEGESEGVGEGVGEYVEETAVKLTKPFDFFNKDYEDPIEILKSKLKFEEKEKYIFIGEDIGEIDLEQIKEHIDPLINSYTEAFTRILEIQITNNRLSDHACIKGPIINGLQTISFNLLNTDDYGVVSMSTHKLLKLPDLWDSKTKKKPDKITKDIKYILNNILNKSLFYAFKKVQGDRIKKFTEIVKENKYPVIFLQEVGDAPPEKLIKDGLQQVSLMNLLVENLGYAYYFEKNNILNMYKNSERPEVRVICIPKKEKYPDNEELEYYRGYGEIRIQIEDLEKSQKLQFKSLELLLLDHNKNILTKYLPKIEDIKSVKDLKDGVFNLIQYDQFEQVQDDFNLLKNTRLQIEESAQEIYNNIEKQINKIESDNIQNQINTKKHELKQLPYVTEYDSSKEYTLGEKAVCIVYLANIIMVSLHLHWAVKLSEKPEILKGLIDYLIYTAHNTNKKYILIGGDFNQSFESIQENLQKVSRVKKITVYKGESTFIGEINGSDGIDHFIEFELE